MAAKPDTSKKYNQKASKKLDRNPGRSCVVTSVLTQDGHHGVLQLVERVDGKADVRVG
jgi:hypothetical protein